MKSYFVDTNYFLRLLLRDNEKQFKTVYSLFQQAIKDEGKLFTSTVVIFEINWVLFSFYQKNKSYIISYLEKILKMTFVDIENREIFVRAIDIFKSSISLDLEDCYNISLYKHLKLQEFATFDKKILKFITN